MDQGDLNFHPLCPDAKLDIDLLQLGSTQSAGSYNKSMEGGFCPARTHRIQPILAKMAMLLSFLSDMLALKALKNKRNEKDKERKCKDTA
jgi:hypothetical protein